MGIKGSRSLSKYQASLIIPMFHQLSAKNGLACI